MRNTRIENNQIYFSRNGELVKISACASNAIRFQAFPGCKEIEENYTLMPGTGEAHIDEQEHHVSMVCGSLRVDLWDNGKVTFYTKDKKILEEKCPGVRFCISQKESAPMEII